MQISKDGMNERDLAVTLLYGVGAMFHGGRLSARGKRAIDRRAAAAHARVNETDNDK